MRPLIPILTVLLFSVAAPAMAGERGGHGGCGGGCGGGHPGGSYSANVNVNVNANATAYAGVHAGAGAYLNARAYDVGAVGARGPVYGGVVSTGGGGGYDHGYGPGYGPVASGYGPVVITGPGYGPSRPHGYVVHGFGRRYVTTDRVTPDRVTTDSCDSGCRPVAPPPACHDACNSGRHGHDGYHGSSARVSGATWSVRDYASERTAWSAGYRGDDRGDYGRDGTHHEEAPRYVPIPYDAAPLEPVTRSRGYDWPLADHAAPPVQSSEPAHGPDLRAPTAYPHGPADPPPAGGYYGDLPPGDTGEGMPYRQEPGERG